MKKFVIALIVVILAGGGFYLYSKKEAKAPTVESYQPAPAQNQVPAQTAAPQTPAGATSSQPANYTPPQAPGGGENIGSNIQVFEVDFDGAAYLPNSSNLKVGDYIFFKNKSAGDFWPVAGSAQTIAAYPKFNPSQPIAAGGEYKFQFTKAGSWSFGDNLHPNSVFSVNVSQ
jgi:plastocyanin